MTHSQPDDNTREGPERTDNQGHQQQKVSWLELFYDLVFVVAFDQLNKRLGDSPGVENLAEFGLLFVGVWWTWAGNAVFAARYGNESRAYRWGTLVQVVSMCMVALTLRGDLADTGMAFALAFGVGRVVQAALYVFAAADQPQNARFARRMAGALFGVSVLWLGSAALPGGGGAQVAVWCVALGVDLLLPTFLRPRTRDALPHEEHLPERVGLLQIIALGGIVTEVVAGGRQQALSAAALLPELSAVLIAVALWRLYFDQARALPVIAAHVEGRVGRALAWLYGHLPFTLSVTMLAVGLGHGISDADVRGNALTQPFVTWPVAGALLTLTFLRATTLRTAHQPWWKDRGVWVLLLGAALSASLSFLNLTTARLHVTVAGLTLTLALLNALSPTTRRLGRMEETAQEHIGELASLHPENLPPGRSSTGGDRPA